MKENSTEKRAGVTIRRIRVHELLGRISEMESDVRFLKGDCILKDDVCSNALEAMKNLTDAIKVASWGELKMRLPKGDIENIGYDVEFSSTMRLGVRRGK